MKLRNLLIATAVLLVLAGFVYYAQHHPSSGQADTSAVPPVTKIADVPAASVIQVDVVRKDGSSLTLKRAGDKWLITAPQQLPADGEAVATLLATLSPLNADSVVEEKTNNIAQYGLTQPSLTVKVYQKNGKTQTFVFGNDVAVGSVTYLGLGPSSKVYAVATNAKTSFDKNVNDLRDKRLLRFDGEKLTSLELTSPKSDLVFDKSAQGDWQTVKPLAGRADNAQVGDLVTKLGGAKMDLSGTADDLKKAQTNFAAGTLVATAKIVDPSGAQSLEVRKNKETYFARSTSLTGAYKVDADLGTSLTKGAEEYRNKKLYDFAFSDLTRIEVMQGSVMTTYLRTGTDWKKNGKVVDADKIQALIDKLRDVAATKLDTGTAGAPVASFTVYSNDGKRREKVTFSKDAAEREGDSTLYRLDAATVSDLQKAASRL